MRMVAATLGEALKGNIAAMRLPIFDGKAIQQHHVDMEERIS
jgi:hypothetical protein